MASSSSSVDSSSVGSNSPAYSSSSSSSPSSAFSSNAFHSINPQSPRSPQISSPEPTFSDPAPRQWCWEDGLPIEEDDWDFSATDTQFNYDTSIDESYGLDSSLDKKISWTPFDEGYEVNSAQINLVDEDEDAPIQRDPINEDDEDKPKNTGEASVSANEDSKEGKGNRDGGSNSDDSR